METSVCDVNMWNKVGFHPWGHWYTVWECRGAATRYGLCVQALCGGRYIYWDLRRTFFKQTEIRNQSYHVLGLAYFC